VPTVQPYVTPLTLGALGLTVGLAILGCLLALFSRQTVPKGWRALRPGSGHWIAAILSAALSTLVAWVYLFVGSSRSDAAFQMRIAFLLSLAFGLGAIYSAWRIRAIKRENVRWRGTKVLRVGPDGQEVAVDNGHAFGWRRTFSGWYVLGFADGSMLYVDPYTRGADSIMVALGPPESPDDPADPPG
jgi:hypothetical protein